MFPFGSIIPAIWSPFSIMSDAAEALRMDVSIINGRPVSSFLIRAPMPTKALSLMAFSAASCSEAVFKVETQSSVANVSYRTYVAIDWIRFMRLRASVVWLSWSICAEKSLVIWSQYSLSSLSLGSSVFERRGGVIARS